MFLFTREKSQINIQTLITETEALGWDGPARLESFPIEHPKQATFGLTGKLSSAKPPHPQWVRDTLVAAGKFANPIEIETVPSDKFMFKVFQRSHAERILQQGPWNVRGFLLILKPWPPELAFEEVELTIYPFWIQVHGLPLQNMTAINAIKIGKSQGCLLEVENGEVRGIICCHHLRFKVEIEISKPIVLGFHFPWLGRDPICRHHLRP